MVDGSFEPLASRIRRHAQSAPARRAVVCDGESLSYGLLREKAERLSRRLPAFGLEPGGERRVGLIGSNGLDFAVVVVGAQLAGVAVVPIPGSITADAQARMVDDAGVAILFADLDHAAAARSAMELSQRSNTVPLVSITPGGVAGATLLDDWLAGAETDPGVVAIDPSWISDIIYSSGTTGVPKGIVQPYRARSAQVGGLAEGLAITESSHLLETVSLYSNFGLAALYLTLWAGGTFFAMRKFSAAAAVATLAREPIDKGWFAPATLVRTLDTPGFEAAVAGKAALKLCAGAPLGVTQKERVLATWAGPFFDLYGQTETGVLTLLAAHAVPASKLGSVGTVVPSASVRILDDEGRALPPEAEGEIAGRTATLAEYHGRSESEQPPSWYDEQGQRYIRTGDVGRLDGDGYLWLCDRKKDMIISGGFNIFPADIERVMQGHPAVLEVAVVGCPSARWGETPVAFVTLRDGESVAEDALREWANSRVGKYQRVAAVRILPALPSGTMGKILKRELRDRHAAGIGPLP